MILRKVPYTMQEVSEAVRDKKPLRFEFDTPRGLFTLEGRIISAFYPAPNKVIVNLETNRNDSGAFDIWMGYFCVGTGFCQDYGGNNDFGNGNFFPLGTYTETSRIKYDEASGVKVAASTRQRCETNDFGGQVSLICSCGYEMARFWTAESHLSYYDMSWVLTATCPKCGASVASEGTYDMTRDLVHTTDGK